MTYLSVHFGIRLKEGKEQYRKSSTYQSKTKINNGTQFVVLVCQQLAASDHCKQIKVNTAEPKPF